MKDNLKMEHKAERERQLQLMKERLAKRRLDQIEQFDAKNDLILAGYNIEPSNKASFQNVAIWTIMPSGGWNISSQRASI